MKTTSPRLLIVDDELHVQPMAAVDMSKSETATKF